jgi:RNA polymerase sigma-70 factor (ECF subfamily)
LRALVDTPPGARRADLERARAIARGDRAAVEAVYRELFEPVYAFVHFRVGGSRPDAEDVVQDAFVTAFEKIGDFEGRSSLFTWICGIARFKALERMRARRREEVGNFLFGQDAEIARALERIETEEVPEAVLEREETSEIVGAALAQLPPHYQQSLLEKYVEGKTFVEIGRARGQTPKAVESLVMRARAAFARVLGILARAPLAGEDHHG